MKKIGLKKMMFMALSFWAFASSQVTWAEAQANLSVEFRLASEGIIRPCPQQSFDYCTLMIPAFVTKFLNITNNSTSVTAVNISSYLSPLVGVTETSNSCASISPGQTCSIGLTADITINPLTLVFVKGTNTNQAFFYVQTA